MTNINIQSVEELKQFLNEEVITTAEAASILDCTRQNIKRLVDIGKLTPIRELDRDRLFLKADIINRKEQMNMKKN